MEDRRCRKVIALLMATVIILGVSVQTVDAAPGNSAANIYGRVVGWQDSLKVEADYLLQSLQSKFNKIALLKNMVARQNSQENEIKFVVQIITSKGENNAGQGTGSGITATRGADPAAAGGGGMAADSAFSRLAGNSSGSSGSAGSAADIKENMAADGSSDPAGAVNSEETLPARESPSRGGSDILEEDIELLARIIYAEARGESFEGQVAVGAVVLNRVESPHFPKTIKEVVYQPGQFTAVKDKQIELKPDSQAYRAAEAALEGADPTNGALFYYNPKLATDKWIKTRSVVRSIGNHKFCI